MGILFTHMKLDDEKQVQDPDEVANPSNLSDHDERDEGLATDKDWDQNSNDPAAIAAQRLKEFQDDDVPLSAEDWETDEKNDDKLPDHINAAVDASLEEMIDKELEREDSESLD